MSVKAHWMVILGVMLLVPLIALAQPGSDEHLKQMQELGGRMEHPTSTPPFYRERTFLVLTGLAITGVGFVVVRLVLRRGRRTRGPVEFLSEAVLVVDLVNSTRLATHYGNGLALSARNALKERTLAAAETRGVSFVENTGDGYFMTFSTVSGAVETATALLKDLKGRPPDLFSGPPLRLRAGVSYGEILLDGNGSRHGMAINKAFRLESLSRESFAQIEGGTNLEEIPDSNRIFVDEEAAQELRHSDIPLRFVGFCNLKGFSGLHRVFEVVWDGEMERSGVNSAIVASKK